MNQSPKTIIKDCILTEEQIKKLEETKGYSLVFSEYKDQKTILTMIR